MPHPDLQVSSSAGYSNSINSYELTILFDSQGDNGNIVGRRALRLFAGSIIAEVVDRGECVTGTAKRGHEETT